MMLSCSFDKDTILIMGGTDRGHSFEELKEPMKHTKLVVAYGETKNRIKEFCDKIYCFLFSYIG